jgi:predicted amidophosphoribosyltransferase
MPEDGKCPECGYVSQAGAAFCGNCGSPLRTLRVKPGAPPSTLPEEVVPLGRQGNDPSRAAEPTEPAESPLRACPSCHSPAGPEDLFCRQCGARLVLRPMYCRRCGDPIDPDERFCNRCGLPLG